jgi:hypothetical protein
MFWSHRNDDSDHPHRAFDLSGVSGRDARLLGLVRDQAGFDYVYVEVSTDGGDRWTA